MNDRVFVDTNVLVYYRDASERVKQPMAAKWLDHLWHTRNGSLSVQVLSEYYVAVTQKLKPGLPKSLAREDIRALCRWNPIRITIPLVEQAWVLQDRHTLSWWDSLIAAAAQTAGCSILLSEDFQDGQAFGDLQVINPFIHLPEELT
jgi:predicted nucleic acid-binding protein